MYDILQFIPQNARKTPSGWYTFNAPCCIHRGETPDKRKRGGVIKDGNNWSYHCFNCGFKTRFVYGHTLSYDAKRFLKWLGVDETTINAIQVDSIRHRQFTDLAHKRAGRKQYQIKFEEHPLPSNARLLAKNDKKFTNYLRDKRGLTLDDYSFYVTPNDPIRRNRSRLIIPYYHYGKVVGWTSRFLDDRLPKYLNEYQQEGYLFGLDLIEEDSLYVIVTEGTFDAISINGVATLHNEINEKQRAQLHRTGREVIIVPDQDKSGLKLIEHAKDANFSVSMPRWPQDVNDVNDAVRKYGKAGALLSILDAKVTGNIRIKLAVQNLQRRKKF